MHARLISLLSLLTLVAALTVGLPLAVSWSAAETCGPVVGTSWSADPVEIAVSDPDQVDCRVLAAAPGDTVVAGDDLPYWVDGAEVGYATSRIEDGVGTVLCSEESLGSGAACTLPEAAEYHFVTTLHLTGDVDVTSFDAAVRAIGPTSDCPVIATQRFGRRATDDHAGIGCRQFDASAGSTYLTQPVGPDGRAKPFEIYDPSFRRSCTAADSYRPLCLSRTEHGRYTLVADVVADTSLTGLHDLSSTDGCGSRPLGSRLHVEQLAPGESRCVRLRGVQAGDRLGLVSRTDPTFLVDAAGRVSCVTAGFMSLGDMARCRARGTGPFRLVVGEGSARTYRTAVLDLASGRGCLDLPPGGRVVLRVEKAVSCLSIRSRSRHWDLIRGVRTSGRGDVSLTGMSRGRLLCASPRLRPSRRISCGAMSSRPYHLYVVGDGRPAVVRVSRR